MKKATIVAIAILIALGLVQWLCVSDASQERVLKAQGATLERDWASFRRPITFVGLGTNDGVLNDDTIPFGVLGELKSLRELHLFSPVGITDRTLARLADLHLSQLQSLSLIGTDISGEGLKYLKNLPNLKNLSLGRTRVDSGLAYLSEVQDLENLDLLESDVTDKGLASLQKCARLRWLDLLRTRVTEAGLEEFRKANPNTTVLR